MTATYFHNARVLTMDPARPYADDLLVDGSSVIAVGQAHRSLPGVPYAAHYDCGGAMLLPAFIDAHCHLLAAAAAARGIDCSPRAVSSIRAIQAQLRAAAADAGPDAWMRAVGYDETQLEERRHPSCRDLDEASPHVPVRLLHRSGHAVVLNTPAMQLAGIGTDTPEPPGAHIERFAGSGEPTGLLLEMSDVVDRVVPPLPYGEIAAGMAEVSRRYLAAGVTAVCDATHTNDVSAWELLCRLHDDGHLPLPVVVMEGAEHAGELPAAPQGTVARARHVKIMLSEVGGLSPDERELARVVRELHVRGRDVAVHAVEERAVAAAIDALEAAVTAMPRAHRHRIEHAALLPAGGAERMARLGVTVVTQPAFLLEQGDRYLRDVARDKHERLYPLGDLLRAGVRIAASSDAPAGSIDALAGVRAAVERRTASGAPIGASQAVALEQALAMWTRDAAWACAEELARGQLAPGMAADLVLIGGEPLRVLAVWVRGVRMWPGA